MLTHKLNWLWVKTRWIDFADDIGEPHDFSFCSESEAKTGLVGSRMGTRMGRFDPSNMQVCLIQTFFCVGFLDLGSSSCLVVQILSGINSVLVLLKTRHVSFFWPSQCQLLSCL